MTNREFLNAVVNAAISDEITDKANALLAAMDSKNEKAKTRPKKANPDVTARREKVSSFVASANGEYTVDEIAAEIELTAPQVSSALKSYVDAGTVKKGTRKIDSKHSKITYIFGE